MACRRRSDLMRTSPMATLPDCESRILPTCPSTMAWDRGRSSILRSLLTHPPKKLTCSTSRCSRNGWCRSTRRTTMAPTARRPLSCASPRVTLKMSLRTSTCDGAVVAGTHLCAFCLSMRSTVQRKIVWGWLYMWACAAVQSYTPFGFGRWAAESREVHITPSRCIACARRPQHTVPDIRTVRLYHVTRD